MSYTLPAPFKEIAREYPDVCNAFENLGQNVMMQVLWMKGQESLQNLA